MLMGVKTNEINHLNWLLFAPICKFINSCSFVGNMTCLKWVNNTPIYHLSFQYDILLNYYKNNIKEKNNFYSYMSSLAQNLALVIVNIYHSLHVFSTLK